jgi:hypothetical protein
MSSRLTSVRAAATALAACAALLVAAGPAGAASATYPGGGSAFADGVEGWSASGLSCAPAELLCTSEAVHDETVGNPPGSIAIETTASVNLVSLFKGTGTWTSPQFTVPVDPITGATLRLDRAFDPGALIDVEPTANYTVTLTDLTDGTSATVLSEEIDKAGGFARSAAPAAVVGGHRYRVSIAVEIVQSAVALSLLSGTTSLGLDNVGLVVRSGGDGKGKDGQGNKSRSLSNRRLFSLLSAGMSSSPVVLKGNRLFVKVNCPRKVGRSCRIAAQGMLTRRKAATRKRVVKIGKGKARRIVLRVKPNARRKLAKRKRLLVRQTVRAGKAKATIYKQRKLIRRP